MTQVIDFIGGEYRNRTGVHGFAIQSYIKRNQHVKCSKFAESKGEQTAKVSKFWGRVQNEIGPDAAATANGAIRKKADQLSSVDTTNEVADAILRTPLFGAGGVQ